MTKREWKQLTTRARAMVDNVTALCWEAGDLLLEAIPPDIKEAKALEMCKRFKEDTGCDFSVRTLLNMRKCAHVWPPEERTYDCPWIVYWSMHLDKNLIRHNMSITEAIRVSPLARTLT